MAIEADSRGKRWKKLPVLVIAQRSLWPALFTGKQKRSAEL